MPCVVKPCSGGSSVGTSIVRERKDLLPALEEAFSCDEAVLVEKYIKARELTVGVGLLDSYHRALDQLLRGAEEFCRARGMRYLRMLSDQSIEDEALRMLARAGLIG